MRAHRVRGCNSSSFRHGSVPLCFAMTFVRAFSAEIIRETPRIPSGFPEASRQEPGSIGAHGTAFQSAAEIFTSCRRPSVKRKRVRQLTALARLGT